MMAKICGITNREDALAAIAGGATALGFNFWPKSPRYIDPAEAGPLLDLPSGAWKVGVFVNEPAAYVDAVARRLKLDVVQLHGDCGVPPGRRVWKAYSVTESFEPGVLDDPAAEAFLLDAPAGEMYGGTGRNFDWELARGAQRKIILAGGLDARNVRRAVETVRPWGVDACSRLESAPGRKDHELMTAFLKAALESL
jgi:phosphoribosylanthranilate isomerase